MWWSSLFTDMRPSDFFNFSFLPKYGTAFVRGIEYTLLLAVVSVLLAVIPALLLALMRLSKVKPVRWLSGAYIAVFRSTPMLVQLSIIYYGLFYAISLPRLTLFGFVDISRFIPGVVALALNSSAYVAEIFRAGILAVDKGQMEAARSLGLSNWQSMRLVVLPQAIKNVLPALANELGLECTWTQVAETTSHTPVVCNVVPNGDISCVNLYKAGGIPAVLKTIEGDLDTSVMTVTGKTLEENLSGNIHIDRDVIRTQDDPASIANGIQVLYGNLAPEGALVKTSAVPADQHVWSGPAMVFNSEEEAFAAYNEKRIVAGTGVVIRYEGPKGGPGMKELHRVTEIMKGIPNSAVITDGRFSGASGGLSVGYLCPEALDGAPIALIQDGDVINIDLTKNLIEVEVSDEELARRKQDWKPVIHENGGRLLARYAKQVGSAKTGAVIG